MRVMSWYMPDEQRNPIQEYQVAHIIPGALFFDLDGISDRTTSEAFSAGCSALGIIDNNDGVVVYDGKGMFSAARVWWKFRVSGHEKVWVLDGGLPRWRALGNAIFKASAASEAIKKIYQGQIVSPVTFKTKFQPHLVWTLDQIYAFYTGTAPEPRKGIRSGHIPGSKCVPFPQMLDSSSHTLLPTEDAEEMI
ncbi:BnaC02g25610D [Brassica napus]|uniref:(rape) hypothetical protein n=1 Tax=Brassica napus TaxID=3708 RepID=A0A078GB07_BRANA|nr:thiosulfate/3-mercaptopyruvate sulfurtransferase 1, mitochondrial isoform X1 [Brassica napus]CAF1914536.1 unnamed protein product [Brassica napus]CDY22257.1 BnaC02g25610D [Brassica napus]